MLLLDHLLQDGGVISGPDSSRWAMPQRRWHRPTPEEIIGSLLWVLIVAGALLEVTGDWGSLIVGSGSTLVGVISGYYRVDEATLYAKRFSHAPEAATQVLVHESVSSGEMPMDTATRELALDYATGWSRRLKRGLAITSSVALAWCLTSGVLVWLLDRRWPESTPTRGWGLAITVIGVAGWLLYAGVPWAWRLRRLSQYALRFH
ncbi:hypothetical protein GTR02_18285 [Kineococcus sp. R8]|uniref:hypothetical protein n=1 Tax=Kineococcus siccus TaxID=2696567 RepID=UPI00141279E5|nr:hypothetical protein [Kineococcus siccus]NAZ83765.1 hypothetical protein [Kineococcus siccus]